MSDAFFKQGIGYTFQDEEKRIIDTNQLVASKLEVLAEIMQKEAEKKQNFSDEFSQGIEASEVEQLLMDPDAQGDGFGMEELTADGMSGNIIKAAPQVDMAAVNAQSEELLANAEAEAREIVEAANAEAEAIRNSAHQEGMDEGYRTGYDEGVNAAKQEYQDKLMELDRRAKELEDEYDARIDELEPQFIDVLTDIYEHVFHVSLSDNKEIVFHLIQDAIRKVEGSGNFIIHVSGEDYGFVSMQKEELLAGIAGAENAEIVEDMTLKGNECYIESNGGIFDCSLETQLAGLKRELRLLSFVKND